MTEPAEIIPFPSLTDQFAGPPSPALDPVLDAAVECLSRHGLAKTSLSDIAREMGVAPSTVYRKLGSVENAARLLMAREGRRLMARLPAVVDGVEGPRMITVFLAECIETTRTHPVVDKILRDEIDWVGRVATRHLDAHLARSAAVSAPLLTAAMDRGAIRRQDATALAHWITRIGMTCIIAPPPGDLLDALDALLLPALTPDST